MEAEKIYKNFEKHTNKWIIALEQYNDKNFALSPSHNEWSIGQVYQHIIAATEKCIDNAILCTYHSGEKKQFSLGPAIFSLIGSFPPFKLKVKKVPPGLENIYYPEQINKADAKHRMEEMLGRMKNAIPVVETASENQKVEHWVGGWFNAIQWYHCAEMHIKHHFRQKKRIDKFLKKNGQQ